MGEENETEVWLDFSKDCKYIQNDSHEKLRRCVAISCAGRLPRLVGTKAHPQSSLAAPIPSLRQAGYGARQSVH